MSPQCREIFNNSFVSVGGGVPLGILVLLPVDVVDHGQGVVVTILLPEDITQGFYMFCLNSSTHLSVDRTIRVTF